MAWTILPRPILVDTVRFLVPVADPAPNVKAALKLGTCDRYGRPQVPIPISQLAARRHCKQLPPLNTATFQTASSFVQPSVRCREQFRLRSFPTAKVIAYTDAIQASAKPTFYHDATIIPALVQPYRQSAARQSKGLPVLIKRSASATDAFRPPPPTSERRLSTRVTTQPGRQKMLENGRERLRKRDTLL